jgi:hypothetical protein
MLGVVFMSVAFGTFATAVAALLGAPYWVLAMTYPTAGALALVGLASMRAREDRQPLLPARSVADHWPVPRNTTPTVSASTLTSVARDTLRS